MFAVVDAELFNMLKWILWICLQILQSPAVASSFFAKMVAIKPSFIHVAEANLISPHWLTLICLGSNNTVVKKKKKPCSDHSSPLEALTKKPQLCTKTTSFQPVSFNLRGDEVCIGVCFYYSVFFYFTTPITRKSGRFVVQKWKQYEIICKRTVCTDSIYSKVFPGSYSNFICTVTGFTVC